MTTPERRREIFAVGLLALALIVLLALLPASFLGERGIEWFPSGNMVGAVGRTVRTVFTSAFGMPAFAVPALLAFAGLRLGRWLSPRWTARLAVFAAGLLLLAPPAAWVLTSGNDAASGSFGAFSGDSLIALVGWLGALLIIGTALVALSVGALGWNPLRSLARGAWAALLCLERPLLAVLRQAGRGGRAVGQGAGRLAGLLTRARRVERADPRIGQGNRWLSGLLARPRRTDAAAEDEDATLPGTGEEADAPIEGMEPDWLESEIRADGTEPAIESEFGISSDRENAAGHDPDGSGAPKHEVPPMDLLSEPEHRDRDSMERQLDTLGRILVDKLESFNVSCSLGDRTTGPVVTQFEVIPATGVKVSRIVNLDADLALAMKAASVRIVAPIPGKGAVGVEIPNPDPEIVNLREILESPEFKTAKGSLPLALGKNLEGKSYVSDLAKMPHVLIAGATGTGKSVCLNAFITSLVYRHTPERLRLLMIDPKMVELSVYSMLPHLRHRVVTNPKDAAGVLKWAVIEMERRYALLKANHVRSIGEFNEKVRGGAALKRAEPEASAEDEDGERWVYDDGIMPHIVVVVDELADLMMTVQSEIEKPLTQLAQKARAIGIHLIVATQRPSVNVITGLIKANFPTRIAFRVASKTDSRTILDMNGADALLGNGDMLFLPPGRSDAARIQGAYLPTRDTERLMAWYVELLEGHGDDGETAAAESDILEEVRSREPEEDTGSGKETEPERDSLFRDAAETCIRNGSGSTSLLQRRLSIGYGRAARIIDQLHEAGVIGASDGAKGREILIDLDELEATTGPGAE